MKNSILLTALLAITAASSRSAASAELWNQDWRFAREAAGPDAADTGWEAVSLPHPVRIEGFDGKIYQGLVRLSQAFPRTGGLEEQEGASPLLTARCRSPRSGSTASS